MADPFTILSRELSKAERKLMLARILASMEEPKQEEELPDESHEPPAWNIDKEYAHLSFLRRIVLLIASFFTHRSVGELTEKLLLTRIRYQIETKAPGLINFQAGCFTSKMRGELEALRPALGFLRTILSGVPRQREFIAFLAGIELAPLNEQIMAETDPYEIYRDQPSMEERAIRSEMWERFERRMDELTHDRKVVVYRDIQRLEIFDSLASLRLEDMIGLFTLAGGAPKLNELETRLAQLSDSIRIVFHPPSTTAWNSLFLYRASEALENPDFDIEKGSASFLTRVSSACRALQGFVHRVPLTAILRYIFKDISYHPSEPKGGEEWQVLLRSFWEDRMEKALREFAMERRRQATVSEALALFGASRFPLPENYRSERHGTFFKARFENCFGFIRGFHQAIFLPKMDRFLKIVNLSGDFYKEENRAAFADCYEKLSSSGEKIARFDAALSDTGERGKHLIELRQESSTPEVRQKLLAVVEEMNRDAGRLIDSTHSTFTQLSRILFGILFGEAGSPYDSITNIRSIGGRENKTLHKALEECIRYLDHASSLLAELKDIELG